MLQIISSNQQNCSTPSDPQLLSTILKTVRHLYTMIENLIKLLDSIQNVFEINKEANNQDYFSIQHRLFKRLSFASFSNTSASLSPITPQPRLFQHLRLAYSSNTPASPLPPTSKPRLL